jgi:hypothetical protein
VASDGRLKNIKYVAAIPIRNSRIRYVRRRVEREGAGGWVEGVIEVGGSDEEGGEEIAGWELTGRWTG